MTIQLSDEAKAFVESQLATGQFTNESEAVSQLLVFLREEKKQWEAETYARVEASIKAADEGRSTKISSAAEAEAFAQKVLRRNWEAQARVGAEQGIADIRAGRYTEVKTPEDALALRRKISRRTK